MHVIPLIPWSSGSRPSPSRHPLSREGRRLALALIGFCTALALMAPGSAHAQGSAGAQGSAATPAAAEEDLVEAPAAMRTVNVPPILSSAIEGLEPYENLRSASFRAWHPSERRILIGTRFADSFQLHEVRAPGGARHQLTFFDEPISGGEYRPGHPEQIAYRRDQGGSEDHQIFLLDRSRATHRRITDGVHRHDGPLWSPDGKLMAYLGNARNGRDTDLYVLDPDAPPGTEAPRARLVAEAEGTWFLLDWSQDGGRILAIRYLSVDETQLLSVDMESGAVTRLDQLGETAAAPAAYLAGKFSRDGKSVYSVTNREAERLRLLRLDLGTGTWTVLSGDIEWEVNDFDLTDDGRLLAFLTNEGGLSRLYFLDLATGESRPAPELPPGAARSLKFRPGSHEIALNISWARSPTDVYSYDASPAGAAGTQPGEWVAWTESEVGGLDPADFPVPELVHFPSFDQREIPAFVFRADPRRHPGPRPVLISIHGGPEGQSRPVFQGSNNYFLNDLGLTVIYPNVRGSTGYGREYVNLDNGRLREDSVKDIGALLDWIATQGDMSQERVMVMGGSYGGYMVLASMVHYNDRLVAGMDVVGISNFVTFLENTRDYRRDLRRAEYGDESDPEMRAFLQQISPANHVERIRKPLLVVQGANDPRVPLSESDQIVAALQAQGTPVWYLVAEDEGHGFRKKKNSDYLRAVTVEFLRRHLLGAGEEGEEAGSAGAAGR